VPALGASPAAPQLSEIGPQAPMPSLPGAPNPLPPRLTHNAPEGTTDFDKNKLAQVKATGSGISQIHSKIENAMPNHPTLGKALGWGAQIPLQIADTVMGARFPNIEQRIPGTELHHQAVLGQANRAVNADLGRERSEAATAATRAEIPVRQAQAEEQELTPLTAEEAKAAGNPLLEGIPFNAAQRAGLLKQAGINTTKEDTTKTAAGPLTADQATQRNALWNPVLTKSHLPTDPFKEGMSDKEATELATQLNNATGKTQAGVKIDLGAGTQGTARADKSYQLQSTRLDKVRQPIEAIQQRVGRLNDTLNQQSPQADALVAPELLSIMSGGQGSGLRMNEAEISRIVGGRSAWESLKANIQHWATDPDKARSITADQDKQIRALVGTVQSKLVAKQKIMDDAEESLLASNDPKEHRQIVADARKKLDAIDAGTPGEQGSSGKAVSLAAAKQLPQNKGKSDDDIRKDIEAHGHKVID